MKQFKKNTFQIGVRNSLDPDPDSDFWPPATSYTPSRTQVYIRNRNAGTIFSQDFTKVQTLCYLCSCVCGRWMEGCSVHTWLRGSLTPLTESTHMLWLSTMLCWGGGLTSCLSTLGPGLTPRKILFGIYSIY